MLSPPAWACSTGGNLSGVTSRIRANEAISTGPVVQSFMDNKNAEKIVLSSLTATVNIRLYRPPALAFLCVERHDMDWNE